MEPTDFSDRRQRAERTAAVLFVGAALVMAILCGAIIVSGWFAGVLEDHAERIFWSGSVVGLLMVFAFAAAAFPGGLDDERVTRRVILLTRIGLVLFIAAPTLCLYALVADYYRLLV